MAYERKFEKVDLNATVIRTGALPTEDAWKAALEHVKMGVVVTPIMVHNPEYIMADDGNSIKATASYDSDRIEHGAYVTESGRDGQYYMVMVDRHNDSDWKALAPCSDYYAAIEPVEIYRNLRKMLAFTSHRPTYVYNAYNGGSQLLRVRIDNFDDVDMAAVKGIHMELVLKTSLDKTSNHSMSVMPVTDDGKPLLFSDTGRNGFNFKVRHTNGARAEIVNFNAAVAAITNAWNTKIVPYVRFLADGDLSEADTMALLQNVMDDANLPKDLTEEVTGACKAAIKSSTSGRGMAVVETISDVVLSRNVTPMSEQRTSEKVTKAVSARVRQLFDKKMREAAQ